MIVNPRLGTSIEVSRTVTALSMYHPDLRSGINVRICLRAA
jgi:hypothetical protein